MENGLRIHISNFSGSLSLACWVILLLPQLLEQWRLKSADGIAIGFIMAWFLGDIANLAGSIWGGLRPNVVLLALWFCFSDTLLILSYVYYSRQTRHEKLVASRHVSHIDHNYGPSAPEDAMTPLLEQEVTSASPLLYPQQNSASQQRQQNWLLSTGLPIVFVLVVGTLSYAISDSTPQSSDSEVGLGPEVLGYISAVLYLGARIPQIIRNHSRRSVEGLSIGFFLLSLLGNLTYAGQILIYRTDRAWVVEYVPWLLGSLGTIVEDLIILVQFYVYSQESGRGNTEVL